MKLTKSGFFLAAAFNYLVLPTKDQTLINFMLHKKVEVDPIRIFLATAFNYYKGSNFDQLYDKTEGILAQ